MLEKQQLISPETRPAQLIMLDILKQLKIICEKHNIKYWLDAGTLLGCIRGGSFIPWDDDLDIGMLREDYDKFREISPKELPKEYFYQTKETDKYYNQNFAKIRKNETLLVETGEKYPEKYHQGIFIDIFPFDYYPSFKEANLISWGKSVRDRKKKYPKGSLKRFFCTIYTNIFLYPKILYAKSRKKELEKKDVNKLYKSTKIVGPASNACGIIASHLDEIFPLRTELTFEGEVFTIPNDYKTYIAKRCGKDYMTLPPIAQRKIHAKKIILNTNNS